MLMFLIPTEQEDGIDWILFIVVPPKSCWRYYG